MNPLLYLLHLLLTLAFTVYIMAVLLRFLLQWVRADFYNPLSRLVVKITHPLLKPLRKVIPSVGKYDLSSIFLAFCLIILQTVIFSLLFFGGEMPKPISLIVNSLIQVPIQLINLMLIIFLLRAILSWVALAGGRGSPISLVLSQLSEPLIRPFRKFIPVVEGFDFSFMVAVITLLFLRYSISYFAMFIPL